LLVGRHSEDKDLLGEGAGVAQTVAGFWQEDPARTLVAIDHGQAMWQVSRNTPGIFAKIEMNSRRAAVRYA
jgi:hypothetical protein